LHQVGKNEKAKRWTKKIIVNRRAEEWLEKYPSFKGQAEENESFIHSTTNKGRRMESAAFLANNGNGVWGSPKKKNKKKRVGRWRGNNGVARTKSDTSGTW